MLLFANGVRYLKEKRDQLIVQGSILAMAGIITKIIGFIYRIPMANMLGEQGNGIYSVSFGIYNVALTLSSYSLPLALSKLVSSRLGKNEPKNAFILFKRAFFFALIAGACAFSVLFFGAEWLEALYSRTGLAHPLKVLAPTAFIVALLGVFRGYFQGHSTMVPTALSQILEQIVNAVVSILATFFFIKAYEGAPDIAARGAAGATVGTLAGAFGALVMLTLFFTGKLASIKKDVKSDTSVPESKRRTYYDIVTTMIPIILSQSIYQIGFTVDDLLYGNIMATKGIEDAVVSAEQGVFNTQYTQLINLPIAIATALAASALPSVVKLFVKGLHKEKNEKITSVIKLTSVITIPCAVGLAVLSEPLISTLFPSLVDFREIAVKLLVYGSSACVFYSIATVTTSVLQGNNRMRLPVINSFISFAIHVAAVFLMLKYTDLSVYALLIGDITFPLVICVLNIISLKKHTGYTVEFKRCFLLPLFLSGIMGGVAFLTNFGLGFIIPNKVIRLGVSFVAAIAVYGLSVLKTNVFTDDEILDLPAGGKILKLKNKLK